MPGAPVNYFFAAVERLVLATENDGPELADAILSTLTPELMSATNSRGFRAIDLLVRGRSTHAVGKVVAALAQGLGKKINDAPNSGEMPPLHAACHNGNLEAARILISAGALVNHPANSAGANLMGGTSAHALASGFRGRRSTEYTEIFTALAQNGCDINALDRAGRKPVDIALLLLTSTRDRTLVDHILEYGVKTMSSKGGRKKQLSTLGLADAIADRGTILAGGKTLDADSVADEAHHTKSLGAKARASHLGSQYHDYRPTPTVAAEAVVAPAPETAAPPPVQFQPFRRRSL